MKNDFYSQKEMAFDISSGYFYKWSFPSYRIKKYTGISNVQQSSNGGRKDQPSIDSILLSDIQQFRGPCFDKAFKS